MDTGKLINHFKEFEGWNSFMYLDTTGHVTVGMGFMIPTMDDAGKLTFSGFTPEQAEDNWLRVKNAPIGYAAKYYAKYAEVSMSFQDITNEFLKRLEGFLIGMKLRFPKFEIYPDNVQIAILDMAYNLGCSGLIRKYPKFCAAIDSKDWKLASQNCDRSWVGKGRNQAVKNLLTEP